MGRARQMTFMLACVVVLSAVVPGLAGYVSARMEAIESAERTLHALELRLAARKARDIRPVSIRGRCGRAPVAPRTTHRGPATALRPNARPARKLGGLRGPGLELPRQESANELLGRFDYFR